MSNTNNEVSVEMYDPYRQRILSPARHNIFDSVDAIIQVCRIHIEGMDMSFLELVLSDGRQVMAGSTLADLGIVGDGRTVVLWCRVSFDPSTKMIVRYRIDAWAIMHYEVANMRVTEPVHELLLTIQRHAHRMGRAVVRYVLADDRRTTPRIITPSDTPETLDLIGGYALVAETIENIRVSPPPSPH